MRIDLKVISSHIITCCKDTTNILNTQIKNAFFNIFMEISVGGHKKSGWGCPAAESDQMIDQKDLITRIIG